MNKGSHFKDEIRNAFFTYSLVPAIIFAVVVICISAIIWNLNLYHEAQQENTQILQPFEHSVNAYCDLLQTVTIPTIYEMQHNSDSVALAYARLKECVLSQKIHADFVVLSSDFSVILKGSNDSDFVIPDWQREFYWGALGRMQEHPARVIAELSSEYNLQGTPQVLLGTAIVDDVVSATVTLPAQARSNTPAITGYLLFIINAEATRSAFYTTTPFAITDTNGIVFISSSQRYTDRFGRLPAEYHHGLGYYMAKEAIYHASDALGRFDVYTFVNVERLQQTIMMIGVMTLLLLAVMIRGLFFSAQRISESKTKTVDIIVDACRNVENGDLSKRVAIESNVEFQTIANAYNDMIENVKRLLEENKKETHEKYVAELKQLEQQFNPHFLFNTLETIKFLIKLDPDKAQKTIINLSSLLRYTINNEISVIPLSEDMHYIENYLYILTMRFGNRFNYTIDVPASIYDCQIPKMILQPLIGNAVKYGCNECESVTLTITARAVGGKLYLTVKDTGSGMEKAKLKEIRQLLKSETNQTNHIGLFNVQRRVQLMYGEGYGLKIDSTKGVGTIARLSLPCLRGDKK